MRRQDNRAGIIKMIIDLVLGKGRRNSNEMAFFWITRIIDSAIVQYGDFDRTQCLAKAEKQSGIIH